MWLRWTLAFDWKGPVALANYRYGSVLNSSGTSVQSQLTSVTRSSALLTSRVYLCGGRPNVTSFVHATHIHTTLPGYVFSNSDIESLPPSIPEEIDEDAKQIDYIALKEHGKGHDVTIRQEALSICFEESGQSSNDVTLGEASGDANDVIKRDDNITPTENGNGGDDKHSLSFRYDSLDQDSEEVL